MTATILPLSNLSLKTSAVLIEAAKLLETKELSRGCYARLSSGEPVGVHDDEVASIDLAAALFLSAEAYDSTTRDFRFGQSWLAVKVFCGHSGDRDAAFAQWLDKRTKEWHLRMLGALVQGLSYESVVKEKNSDSSSVTSIEEEYV